MKTGYRQEAKKSVKVCEAGGILRTQAGRRLVRCEKIEEAKKEAPERTGFVREDGDDGADEEIRRRSQARRLR
ncbi:hypothetical protein [Thermicanus aegyptius]|uniref:hypothetical protein n=1 Tax=Thermicanus aegyptius TaxID=94009 RepID=UPI0003F88510|nr:hypothetical protein [Thermicanus aegyptius]